MIRIFLKNNLIELYSYKLFFVILIFSIYSIEQLQAAQIHNITTLEYIIIMMSDHYYLLFGILIFYISFMIKFKRNKEYIILIRNKSYLKFFISEIISLFIFTLIFIFIHIFISFFMSIFHLDFNMSYTNTDAFETLSFYRDYFKNPLIALSCIYAYLAVGLTFFAIILRTIDIYANTITGVACTLTLYFGAVIALSKGIDVYFPYIFINNYLILHHSMGKGITLQIISIVCIVIIIITYIIKKSFGVKKYV